MKFKYKANLQHINYSKDVVISFGYYFDYKNIYSNYIKFFNRLLNFRFYKINIRCACLTSRFDDDKKRSGYETMLNTILTVNKSSIKRNNKICISFYKYIITINIKSNKEFNEDKYLKLANKLKLE